MDGIQDLYPHPYESSYAVELARHYLKKYAQTYEDKLSISYAVAKLFAVMKDEDCIGSYSTIYDGNLPSGCNRNEPEDNNASFVLVWGSNPRRISLPIIRIDEDKAIHVTGYEEAYVSYPISPYYGDYSIFYNARLRRSKNGAFWLDGALIDGAFSYCYDPQQDMPLNIVTYYVLPEEIVFADGTRVHTGNLAGQAVRISRNDAVPYWVDIVNGYTGYTIGYVYFPNVVWFVTPYRYKNPNKPFDTTLEDGVEIKFSFKLELPSFLPGIPVGSGVALGLRSIGITAYGEKRDGYWYTAVNTSATVNIKVKELDIEAQRGYTFQLYSRDNYGSYALVGTYGRSQVEFQGIQANFEPGYSYIGVIVPDNPSLWTNVEPTVIIKTLLNP